MLSDSTDLLSSVFGTKNNLNIAALMQSNKNDKSFLNELFEDKNVNPLDKTLEHLYDQMNARPDDCQWIHSFNDGHKIVLHRIPANIKYLDQTSLFTSGKFPENCIISKGETGRGATTAALRNNENIILLVPAISSVEEKGAKFNDVFTITGDVSVADIAEATRHYRKFVCTYDSVMRAVDGLGTRVLQMKMIIDECHLIPNFSRIFKPAVILDIIKASKMFKSVTLVSASLGELDHYQELFGNMDVHHYVWDDIRSYDFTAKRYYKSKDMNDDLARAIISIVKANKIQIQQGKPIQEIALFYNHISSIGIILNTVLAALPELKNEINFIRSNDPKHEETLIKKIGFNIPKGKLPNGKNNKMLNIYTSCVHECVDMVPAKNNHVQMFVVSNAQIKSMQYSNSVELRQIHGRYRDTNRVTINHFFIERDEKDFQDREQYASMVENVLNRSKCITGIIQAFAKDKMTENIIYDHFQSLKLPDMHPDEDLFCIVKYDGEYIINPLYTIAMKHDYLRRVSCNAALNEGHELENSWTVQQLKYLDPDVTEYHVPVLDEGDERIVDSYYHREVAKKTKERTIMSIIEDENREYVRKGREYLELINENNYLSDDILCEKDKMSMTKDLIELRRDRKMNGSLSDNLIIDKDSIAESIFTQYKVGDCIDDEGRRDQLKDIFEANDMMVPKRIMPSHFKEWFILERSHRQENGKQKRVNIIAGINPCYQYVYDRVIAGKTFADIKIYRNEYNIDEIITRIESDYILHNTVKIDDYDHDKHNLGDHKVVDLDCDKYGDIVAVISN